MCVCVGREGNCGRLPFGFDFGFLSGPLPIARSSGDRQGATALRRRIPIIFADESCRCCAHLISVTDHFPRCFSQPPLSLSPLRPPALTSPTERPRTPDDTPRSTRRGRFLCLSCPPDIPPTLLQPLLLRHRAPPLCMTILRPDSRVLLPHPRRNQGWTWPCRFSTTT